MREFTYILQDDPHVKKVVELADRPHLGEIIAIHNGKRHDFFEVILIMHRHKGDISMVLKKTESKNFPPLFNI